MASRKFPLPVVMVLATVIACSGSSATVEAEALPCCNAVLRGNAVCLCGPGSLEGIACTSEGSPAGCTISCRTGGVDVSATGTPSGSCTVGDPSGAPPAGGYTPVDGNADGYDCADPETGQYVRGGDVCAGAAQICREGRCQGCGGPSQPCCPGSTCSHGCCWSGTCVAQGSWCGVEGSGKVCVTNECDYCGIWGRPCCPGGACGSGNVCAPEANLVPGRCVTCGSLGRPCCTSGAPCDPSAGTCTNGMCQ